MRKKFGIRPMKFFIATLIQKVSSLRASSPIWASEASRARTCERAAKPRGAGLSLPRPRQSRLLSRASRACTFHDIPQMESLLVGQKVSTAVHSDGIQHTTLKSIASAMNSVFASIGKRLADKITTTWPSCNSSTVQRTGQMHQTTGLSLFCLHSAIFLRKLYIHSYTSSWLPINSFQENSLDIPEGIVHYICSDILCRRSPSQYGTGQTMWSRVFGPNKSF